MNPSTNLTITTALHQKLHAHLFPGDGLEAAAILLCARTPGPRVRLLVKEVLLVPHSACKERRSDYLVWPGAAIEEAIDLAEADGLSLMLTHSHPGGLFGFSRHDDQSDLVTVPGLIQALGGLHGTAIMTPDGAMLARLYQQDLSPIAIKSVMVAGDDLTWHWTDRQFSPRPTAFTSEATQELGRLSACVIGVSGTGSLVAEQLARLGFGQVILIDFDKLELRNLNRIVNSTLEDAKVQRPKVFAFADAVTRYRGEGVAVPVNASISTREGVLQASQADVMFSCVDTLDARQIADLLGASFLIPLFDVGVSIPTRKAKRGAAIADVCGRIDYVSPGGPTLQERGVYDPASLRAEYLRRSAPDAHTEEMQAGYLRGVAEEAPAVIALNMRAASACVMEFIARAYPFRHESNAAYARTQFSLAANEEEAFPVESFQLATNPQFARGDLEPLLGLPALRIPKSKAFA
ncbi:thiamine biosynthesis protein ThiF [Acidovorax sp. Leaf76]|uniref:ThiF family adenylyltransferase n=1 Tax=unclassified Acidovorax TaxID=2684926 RepID=UPI0006FBF8BF|nr:MULTISPECIES: ThiF family adenylyltransferase [unclassified Acidovorax]KQO26407.1 thiamine biosynthesis protein ThiF [Acidovorax sp. Leaf76]KQO40180.1 thiamine biosynthesis protein ThiF [Acidovorax sp. Leaf84]KQS42320.1 thiamine biosynthesis protein ThiF [Acidovorax sp. Leaf191]